MGVLYGAQNVTSQEFKAISATPSSLVFNIVVPSIETIFDRRLMIRSTMILRIDIQNPIAGAQLINYGVTDALAPFPFNQLIQNIQCSINNNNITLQQSDLFDVLLRMQDPEDLARFDGKTPTGLDFLYDYADGVTLNPYYIDLKQMRVHPHSYCVRILPVRRNRRRASRTTNFHILQQQHFILRYEQDSELIVLSQAQWKLRR
jgi:hypothetical protein